MFCGCGFLGFGSSVFLCWFVGGVGLMSGFGTGWYGCGLGWYSGTFFE